METTVVDDVRELVKKLNYAMLCASREGVKVELGVREDLLATTNGISEPSYPVLTVIMRKKV